MQLGAPRSANPTGFRCTRREFCLELLPLDAVRPVVIETGQPAFKLVPLVSRKRNISIAHAVPQITNERQALRGA